MKALIVLASPPLSDGGAPGKHAIALIRGLRTHGVDVQTIAAGQFFSGQPPLDLEVKVVAADEPQLPRLRRLRSPGRALIGGAFAACVRDAANGVDVVHFEQVDTSWLDQGVSTPSLVHIHHRIRLDQGFGPPPWRREALWIAERARIERSALRRHRYVLASSPLVKKSLDGDASHAEVVLAPLALDGNLYPLAAFGDPPVAGLIGTAHWAPTREAMTRLVRRVWPAVRERVPGARLLIAGRGTDSLIGGPGVEILGETPSAVEFLHRLTVLVFPLSRGSGMKIKVLESIACGLPVVTTRAGAEGIDAGEGIVVEEDDDRLAAATASLLLDQGEAVRRGGVARAAFEATYTPGPATAPVVDFYRRMISG